MLDAAYDLATDGLNWLFWGFCKCVFHGFRFVELLIFVMDFFVNSIHVILAFNSAIISSGISFVQNCLNKFGYFRLSCKEIALSSVDYLSATPNRLVKSTERAVEITTDVCYKLVNDTPGHISHWLSQCWYTLYASGANLLSTIPETLTDVSTFTRECIFKIVHIIATSTSNLLCILTRNFFDGLLYVAKYIINFAEWTRDTSFTLIYPAVTFMITSGEFVAESSINTTSFIFESVFKFFSTIGSHGKTICWKVIYLPLTILKMMLELMYYVNRIVVDVFYIIVDVTRQLNMQEFLLGLLLTVLFIAFFLFLLQNRNALSIGNFFQQPLLFLRIVYEKVIGMLIRHERAQRNHVFRVVQREHVVRTPTFNIADNAVNTNSKDEAPCTSNDTSCVVCQDGKKSVVLLPCKHLCLCAKCVDTILRLPIRDHKCPLCRRQIRDFLSVYT